MKTFSINTLGCKVNQYETQQIRQLLESFGLKAQEPSQGPGDLVIINTCCVTHTASAKSRQFIRKAQRLNPDAQIVVSGCLPGADLDELPIQEPGIHLVKHRHMLGAALSQIAAENASVQQEKKLPNRKKNAEESSKKTLISDKMQDIIKLPPLTEYSGQTRAFLKVQDGCDGFCSYCIVPRVRPKLESKPVAEAVAEAQELVRAGHREIVVTGVFLGGYGKETVKRRNWEQKENVKLPQLLQKLAEIEGLERIRLSSLEPGDVTQKLLDVFCENHNIMSHLHLSLQSGSDNILKKMNRQYSRQEYLDKIDMARQRLDRPAITTDIIAGFPGETDEDFAQTLDLVAQAGFSRIHVFPYSPRKGTAAALMKDSVTAEVKKNRCRQLRELAKKKASQFREQFVGENTVVLTEASGGKIVGRTERYFLVYFKTETDLKKNQIAEVTMLENLEDGMLAEVINTNHVS